MSLFRKQNPLHSVFIVEGSQIDPWEADSTGIMSPIISVVLNEEDCEKIADRVRPQGITAEWYQRNVIPASGSDLKPGETLYILHPQNSQVLSPDGEWVYRLPAADPDMVFSDITAAKSEQSRHPADVPILQEVKIYDFNPHGIGIFLTPEGGSNI